MIARSEETGLPVDASNGMVMGTQLLRPDDNEGTKVVLG